MELREAKKMKFMNLKQGSLSVRVYSLKFNKLSKNVIYLVTDPQARIDKFVLRLSNLVNEECRTAILIREMDISWLMSYNKKLERENLGKRKMGESKRSHFEGRFHGAKVEKVVVSNNATNFKARVIKRSKSKVYD